LKFNTVSALLQLGNDRKVAAVSSLSGHVFGHIIETIEMTGQEQLILLPHELTVRLLYLLIFLTTILYY